MTTIKMIGPDIENVSEFLEAQTCPVYEPGVPQGTQSLDERPYGMVSEILLRVGPRVLANDLTWFGPPTALTPSV